MKIDRNKPFRYFSKIMMETNKIYHGDCLDIMRTFPDKSVDCCVTDCPYKIIAGGIRIIDTGDEPTGIFNKRDYSKTDPQGVLGRGRIAVSDGSPISNKRLKKGQQNIPSAVKSGKMFEHNEIQFSEWLPELYRIMKDKSHTYIMVNGRNLKDLQVEAEKVGFEFQNLLIWEKENLTPNKYYMQGAEFILMLKKNGSKNINNMGSSNIIKIPNIIGTKMHPTEKPVELYKYLIENSTQPGEIVIDPFAGCGPIINSCIFSNRKYIAIEIDDEYVKVMNDRLTNLQKPLF